MVFFYCTNICTKLNLFSLFTCNEKLNSLVIKLLNILFRAAAERREGGESCFSKTGQASHKMLLWLSASATSLPHVRLVITTMVPLWGCHQTDNLSPITRMFPLPVCNLPGPALKQTLSETAGFQPEEPIAQAAAEPVRAAGHATGGCGLGRMRAPALGRMG